MILAADVGGTKTLLALFSVESKSLTPSKKEYFVNVHYNSFYDILQEFLAQCTQKPLVACFGIAGPIENGVCRATNLPWEIDAQKIKKQFSLKKATLINDLEANAYGIDALQDEDIYTLREGQKREKRNKALIAAGTGLGEAPIFFSEDRYIPSASEGGHCGFSPRNDKEIELLRFLQEKYSGHASYERLISGMGIVNIYEFLTQRKKLATSNIVYETLQSGDKAEGITGFAKTKKCDVCSKTISWFLSIYGAEAGNLALKTLSLSGFYVGGGIAPKLLEELKQSDFLQSFSDKGRFKALLDSIPIYIILREDTALLGAFLNARKHYSKD